MSSLVTELQAKQSVGMLGRFGRVYRNALSSLRFTVCRQLVGDWPLTGRKPNIEVLDCTR